MLELWTTNAPLVILIAILIVVVPLLIFYLVKAKREHPKGLIAAALSNMGERFGYYIMNAVLALFLASKFGISDDAAGWIYAVFYFSIYVLALPGGLIADRLQNYKGTIITGLLVMAIGYALLAVPVFGESFAATTGHISGILVFTCFALLLIAIGNGLFKGNLQAIVGQMYDNFEAEGAKISKEELERRKTKRDPGFQIFYVFINIGGVIAPFVAPLLRSWWLKAHDLIYNSSLPKLCHQLLNEGTEMTAEQTSNLTQLAEQVQTGAQALPAGAEFAENYLNVFNTGVHYSYIASVAAMVISLLIFLATKKKFPNPAKKEKKAAAGYTEEERLANAKEIRQRLYALFAVLGVAVFFWFSFHQNGQSLSFFARDFVNTENVPPEVWQCINPFFVIILTPIIMGLFAYLATRGKKVSTPRKIALGMFITALAYIFLIIIACIHKYPSLDSFDTLTEAVKATMRTSPTVLILTYFFLTVAELFISPLGLSFVSKVAPKHLQGICQGLWLCATAIGNLFIALGVTMLRKFPQQWETWAVFAAFCLISMGVMLGMVKWLEKVTSD